jgi:hypothetical protein
MPAPALVHRRSWVLACHWTIEVSKNITACGSRAPRPRRGRAGETPQAPTWTKDKNKDAVAPTSNLHRTSTVSCFWNRAFCRRMTTMSASWDKRERRRRSQNSRGKRPAHYHLGRHPGTRRRLRSALRHTLQDDPRRCNFHLNRRSSLQSSNNPNNHTNNQYRAEYSVSKHRCPLFLMSSKPDSFILCPGPAQIPHAFQPS